MKFYTKLVENRYGNIGVLLLEAPQTWDNHYLTLDILHKFQDVLVEWHRDYSMVGFILKADRNTDQKSFCHGWNVDPIWESALKQETKRGTPIVHGQGRTGLYTSEFFRQEYNVNHMLANATLPQVSFWDGIVTNTGAGLSMFGNYRVATERTLFRIEEPWHGLFPDCGSMYWLPRTLKESTAAFMALTGFRIRAADLLNTGLATHYIPSCKLDDVEGALVTATLEGKVVAPILGSYHETPPDKPALPEYQDEIDQTFGFKTKSVEDIVASLEKLEGYYFKMAALEALEDQSPTMLKVTLEGLRRGALCETITEVLAMEYRMIQSCFRPGSDFFEGVRRRKVKNYDPEWKFATWDAVTKEEVESYFAPIENEWEVRAFDEPRLRPDQLL